MAYKIKSESRILTCQMSVQYKRIKFGTNFGRKKLKKLSKRVKIPYLTHYMSLRLLLFIAIRGTIRASYGSVCLCMRLCVRACM